MSVRAVRLLPVEYSIASPGQNLSSLTCDSKVSLITFTMQPLHLFYLLATGLSGLHNMVLEQFFS